MNVMDIARPRKIYLSITWYLVLFLVVAMVPVGVSTYLSVRQANGIQSQAQAQMLKFAHQELRRELGHIGLGLANLAESLVGWDETRALFRDPTYYNYWKESRVKDIARFQVGQVDEIDLFLPDGRPLTPDVRLASAAYLQAAERPMLLRQGKDIYVVYFHPVEYSTATPATLLGYVGVLTNLNVALLSADAYRRMSIQRVQWHLPDGVPVPVMRGVDTAELEMTPSPEIEAFSRLVRQGFFTYLVYTVGVLLLLGLLLTFSIARPLRRLTGHLREIRAGGIDPIPEDFHSGVNIRELEDVRVALNDYKSRLLSAASTLEQKNKELMRLTFHDPLTGHFNRRAFEARLQRAIEAAVVEGKQHALCYIDVDQFKVVNDTCGHVAGDELLKRLAGLLESEIRDSDMLARLGGDEFGVLWEGCDLKKAAEHAEAMRLKVRQYRFVWQDKPFDVSISLGLVPITTESLNMEEVMKKADAACYVAKDSGRNRLQIYRPHDKELAQRSGEMQWVSRLRAALEENRFELHGQLIRPVTEDAGAMHYEVLVRLRDPDGQLVPPMAFIPAAERYNLMTSIDQWVIRQALGMLAQCRAKAHGKRVALAINLSGQSLGNEELLASIQRLIRESGVEAKNLCFEITETAAITNLAAASRFIHQLRALGCRFSLDDFGSGLSSFGYLSNLEVDYIKIDGHFIKHILTDPLSRSIVDAINRIGHVMGIHTIAEFVENNEIADILEQIGIDYVQGFGIHKPEPLGPLLGLEEPTGLSASA